MQGAGRPCIAQCAMRAGWQAADTSALAGLAPAPHLIAHRSGQAYVGAFLKRPEKAAPAAAAASDAAKAAAAATTDGGAAGTDGAAAAADSVAAAADGVTGAAAAEGAPAAVEDAAGHLYDVGTFAQVRPPAVPPRVLRFSRSCARRCGLWAL